MKLIYSSEIINNPEGIPCTVLDVTSVDFTQSVEGRKATETLVRRAKGGERIETKNSEGKVESIYTAQLGDAIFINLHNPDDIYVPSDTDGTRWQFDGVLEKGYEVSGEDKEKTGILVKSTTVSKLLHEAVKEPTCIKDAWGSGQHQFLFEGATLKQSNNRKVTGIDKEAFDATWELLPSNNQYHHKPKPPSCP